RRRPRPCRRRDPARRLAALEARARPDDVPAQRRPGRRLLLARRQRPDPDRHRCPPQRQGMSETAYPDYRSTRIGRFTLRQLSIVQWVGVVVAPLAWTGQHVVGYGVGQARCEVGASWGIGFDAWQLAILAAAGLLAAGPAGSAAGGTPKKPLAAHGYHLYGEYCLGCHGGNAAGRANEPSNATGAGPGRDQGQQAGIAPSLQGVGALAADFYLRTGYMPLRHLGLQPRREPLVLSARQIRALVAYIASFGGPPIPKPKP